MKKEKIGKPQVEKKVYLFLKKSYKIYIAD